ncbi:MAG: MFS transporter [Planctomycetaceae bacterium]
MSDRNPASADSAGHDNPHVASDTLTSVTTTNVRFQVVGVTTLAAVMLYLDRVCIAEIAKLQEFTSALTLTEKQTGAVLSAFFFTYALAQVPAGWLSDRFGARLMLPAYIAIWSVCTMLTGLANGFVVLIAARMLFGLAQAGCYPTASSLVKRWISLPNRGTASGIVSFGGRVGGAIAPILTAFLLADVVGWRMVLVIYGLAGFVVAAAFRFVVRDRPAEHPDCNEVEQNLITQFDTDATDTGRPPFPPLLPLVRSPTMWLMCMVQYGINIGWVFLVTWLPKYLQDVKHVDAKVGGLMSTTVLCAGIVGMLSGGPITDRAVRVLGRRWGRSLPVVASYVLAVSAYLSCLYLESAWAFIAAASLVAFATDLSVPAIWAYMQDVGGRNTAAVFGWGNMWGNLGAATTPLLVPIVLEQWDTNGDWHEAFLLFACGFTSSPASPPWASTPTGKWNELGFGFDWKQRASPVLIAQPRHVRAGGSHRVDSDECVADFSIRGDEAR